VYSRNPENMPEFDLNFRWPLALGSQHVKSLGRAVCQVEESRNPLFRRQHLTSQADRGEYKMSLPQKKSPDKALPVESAKIDRNAPAGSPNSLGAKSIRDGRPATDDSVVEAMDEKSPDITVP
jgi:hypothetical protein